MIYTKKMENNQCNMHTKVICQRYHKHSLGHHERVGDALSDQTAAKASHAVLAELYKQARQPVAQCVLLDTL